ncbi:hypothetical protein BDV39DRAFT_37904 [Aspergillus sergii]|uniref:Uncharacterized protein n=1 Tax=Aspergillus sergii TaxID=1034303 RepID=A0A5N6WM30_9EURO|nr:hypothetical protein BDV39DRAFT_37904 [Aspergillus sergii]
MLGLETFSQSFHPKRTNSAKIIQSSSSSSSIRSITYLLVMESQNAVMGCSDTHLNSLISQLFKNPLTSKTFTQFFEVIKTTLSISIDDAPTIEFFPHRALSIQFQRYLRDYIFGNSDIISPSGSKSEAAFQSYIAQISQGGFTLRIPRCTVLLSRDAQPNRSCRPIRLQCGVDFTGSIINATEMPNQTLIIYDGNFISLGSQDHDLDDIMNGFVLPFAITEMNKVCLALAGPKETESMPDEQ